MYEFKESVCSKENIMRTTINIQDDLMEALLAQTKAKTKTKAIELSVREYIEKKSIENIVALSGKINVDSDWQKMEEDELNGLKLHQIT
jgi:Arc/MetJ family transcription regulator